mmetsp:Transcript_26095/g.55939  ORF Transcript_26095/g.55939 Transcript_26095/m.55939 type:complete len:81 (-) Transcript_26095:64-306(-)
MQIPSFVVGANPSTILDADNKAYFGRLLKSRRRPSLSTTFLTAAAVANIILLVSRSLYVSAMLHGCPILSSIYLSNCRIV